MTPSLQNHENVVVCFEFLLEKAMAAELPADNKKARSNLNDSDDAIIVKS